MWGIVDWRILSGTQGYGTVRNDTGWHEEKNSCPGRSRSGATAPIGEWKGRLGSRSGSCDPTASRLPLCSAAEGGLRAGGCLLRWRGFPRRSQMRAGKQRSAQPRRRTSTDDCERQRPPLTTNTDQYLLTPAKNQPTNDQRPLLSTVTAIVYNSPLTPERMTPLHRGCGKGGWSG